MIPISYPYYLFRRKEKAPEPMERIAYPKKVISEKHVWCDLNNHTDLSNEELLKLTAERAVLELLEAEKKNPGFNPVKYKVKITALNLDALQGERYER